MVELDEKIEILKEEVKEAEKKKYEGMSVVETLMLYQNLSYLLEWKIRLLTNKSHG